MERLVITSGKCLPVAQQSPAFGAALELDLLPQTLAETAARLPEVQIPHHSSSAQQLHMLGTVRRRLQRVVWTTHLEVCQHSRREGRKVFGLKCHWKRLHHPEDSKVVEGG